MISNLAIKFNNFEIFSKLLRNFRPLPYRKCYVKKRKLSFNTWHAAKCKAFCFWQFSHIFKAYLENPLTNSRHVCTYLNAFLTVISNMAMTFNNFEIFRKLLWNFRPTTRKVLHQNESLFLYITPDQLNTAPSPRLVVIMWCINYAVKCRLISHDI